MPASRTIDPGQYTNATKDQSIFVSGNQIEFDILIEEKNQLRRLKKSYDYSMWHDGSLTFRPMVSSQYGKGVTAYKWHWNSSTIFRSNRQNGQTMSYKLQVSPVNAQSKNNRLELRQPNP